MKFKFCGDADAPDWLLAEMFTISKLSSVRVRLLCAQLVHARATTPKMHEPFGTNERDDTDADASMPSSSRGSGKTIDYAKLRKLIDDSIGAGDVEAVVAALDYTIANATRHDVDEKTLGRELEQLGLPKEHAEAVCKPYGKEREALREAAMRSTVRVNGLRDLRWGVTFASDADESRNNASEGRLAIRLTLDTIDEGRVDVNVSEEKFRVLLSELKAVKALMDEDA